MTSQIIISSALSLGLVGGAASAQSGAAATALGASASDLQALESGWSLKNSIVGKKVYNDADETVGTVEDAIIAPDGAVMFAVVGVGGFLGVASHDVAIPVKNFRVTDGKIALPGASKQALKQLPKFEYAKN